MKQYSKPSFEVSEFSTEDIMLVSGTQQEVNNDFDKFLEEGGYQLIGGDGEEINAGGAGAAFYWN